MGSTYLSGFGFSPGPMTLASSMFLDSEPDFALPSFSSQLMEPIVTEFQPQAFPLPPGITSSSYTENLAGHEAPLYAAVATKQADNDKPGEDGYNWRKYGQKQVKERERGYYRCSFAECSVKKIVEWSVDGLVDSITYRGHHNHQLPGQTNKRGRDVVNLPLPGHELGTPRQASFASKSGNGPRVIGQDERQVKRRNEVGSAVCNRSSREPKIIVQTNSAVDLLDDGFRWRKYGQKVVKCNPHPRSYYKCTTPGCNVRKQVERAATDHKAVITIYEGKHNHQVPIAKNITT